jgi:hypothetical protein
MWRRRLRLRRRKRGRKIVLCCFLFFPIRLLFAWIWFGWFSSTVSVVDLQTRILYLHLYRSNRNQKSPSAANHEKSKFFPAVSGLASRKRHPRLTAKDCLTPHRSFLDRNWGNKILYVRVEIGLQILAYRFWGSQPQTLPEITKCAR